MLERRNFLKLAAGVSLAVVAVSATTAQAAPFLLKRPDNDEGVEDLARENVANPNSEPKPEPALATDEDLDSVQLEQVQWRRRRGWGRRRWRRRYWRPRYYFRPRRRRIWRRRRYYW